MRKLRVNCFLSVTILLILSAGNHAMATNGYFSQGYGVHGKGMVGVGITLPYSSLSSAVNPASLAFLGRTRYDVAVSLFNPNRRFMVEGNPSGFPGTFPLAPGTTESDHSLFLIPAMAGSWRLNDKSALGVAIYGNGGMNTEYPAPVFGSTDATTGVNLSQLFINTSYARMIGENHSIGVSGIAAFQFFEATGLENFAPFSSNPNALSSNGSDHSAGYGFRVGYQGALTDLIRIGIAYQSKIKMSEFEHYAGLFAEHGGFDIPANWTAGISYKFSPDWLLAVDVQQILYSTINSIANPIDPMALPPAFPDGNGGYIPNDNQIPLGEDDGSGFGWNDMTVIKIGMEFTGIEDWAIRAGFSFGDQPIKESEMLFNILAPGIIENHASAGFTWKMKEKNELSFALTHGFLNSISGPNPFEAQGQQTIELEMDQWEFSVGFSF